MSKKFVYCLLALIVLGYAVEGIYFNETFGRPEAFYDFNWHLDKIDGQISQFTLTHYEDNGALSENYVLYGFASYPSGVHQILGRLGITNAMSLYFVMLLIIFVLPTIFFIEKFGAWAGLLFLSIELPHLELLQATLPQAVIVLLLLIYFANRKNWLLLFSFFFLSFALHDKAPLLFGLIIIIELIDSWLKRFKVKNYLKSFNYLVVPTLPVTVKTQLVLPTIALISLFQTPLPALWLAWKRIFSSFFAGALFVLSIFMSFTVSPRVAFIAETIFIICAAQALRTATTKQKRIILAYSLITLVLMFFYVSFYSIKNF